MIFNLLRIKHYIKNFLIFLPLLLVQNIENMEIISLLAAFFGFCFISSAVYIINDIIDYKKDKNNPLKVKRPIASGLFKKKDAFIISLFLILAGLFIAYYINLYILYLFIFYISLNLLYSFYFKNILIIDSLAIAIFFLIRLFTGCFVLGVYPFYSMIFLVFFTSLFFALSKRKLENNIYNTKYSQKFLKYSIITTSILSIVFYFIFIQNINLSYITYLTLFLFSYIILKFSHSVFSAKNQDTINLLLHDKTIIISFLGIVFIFILTFFVDNQLLQ